MKKVLSIALLGLFGSANAYYPVNNGGYNQQYYPNISGNTQVFHHQYTPSTNTNFYQQYYPRPQKQSLAIFQKNVFPDRIDVWINKSIANASGYNLTCTPHNTIYAGAQTETAQLCINSNSYTPLTINNLFSNVSYKCRAYAINKQGITIAEQRFTIKTPATKSDEYKNPNSRTVYHLQNQYFGGQSLNWGTGRTYKPNQCRFGNCNR